MHGLLLVREDRSDEVGALVLSGHCWSDAMQKRNRNDGHLLYVCSLFLQVFCAGLNRLNWANEEKAAASTGTLTGKAGKTATPIKERRVPWGPGMKLNASARR